MILDNLKTSGVQQAHKEDRISFSGIRPWPGYHVCAEGTYVEGNGDSGAEKRAGIFVGPEFGTVSRPDLVTAVREAADADFDVLVACAFNYDAHASEFNKLGRVPVLKARMNADLHMADDLKTPAKATFSSSSASQTSTSSTRRTVKSKSRSTAWTYSIRTPGKSAATAPTASPAGSSIPTTTRESFFVRHAYFLGASDPYKSLRTTLKAEVNQEAWETLHSDTSRPFAKPTSRPHCGEGDQSPGGRGDEGVPNRLTSVWSSKCVYEKSKSHWRHFENVELELSNEAPLVCLVGANGTGKSHLLELIASCAHRLGLSQGIEIPRGDPFNDPHFFSLQFYLAKNVSDAVDVGLSSLPEFAQWDRTLTIQDRREDAGSSSQILAGGIVDQNQSRAFAQNVVDALRQSQQVHFLSLDADRSYPKKNINFNEVAQAYEIDWDEIEYTRGTLL